MTSPDSGTPALGSGPVLRLSWQPNDRHRWLTGLSIAALAAATAMAIFGLPPLDLHGPLHYLGVMDPLCGGTRAARYTMRGDLTLAWQYNPLGILSVIAAALLVLRALVGFLTSRWLTMAVAWTPMRRRVAIAIGIALFVGMAVRQQLRAGLLEGTSMMAPW